MGFDFELGDLQDDEFFDSAATQFHKNVNPRGNEVSLKTSRSQETTPRRGLATFSLSELMQGAGIYRSSGFVSSQLNQSLSSDLSGLLLSEGGVTGVLGERSRLLPYGIGAQRGLSDGRFDQAQGINGQVRTGGTGGGPAQDLATLPSDRALATYGSHAEALQDLDWSPRDNLKGHTAAAREFIQRVWGPSGHIQSIGGYRPKDDYEWHPDGRALDVMTSSGETTGPAFDVGCEIAQWFLDNHQVFNTQNVIWWDYVADEDAWRVYGNPQSKDFNAQHRNHVHIAFYRWDSKIPGPMGGAWSKERHPLEGTK